MKHLKHEIEIKKLLFNPFWSVPDFLILLWLTPDYFTRGVAIYIGREL